MLPPPLPPPLPIAANVSSSGGTMELLWSDEFDGGKAAGCSSIDASKWDVQVGNGCQYGISGWGNDEM